MKNYQATIYQIEDAILTAENNQDMELLIALTTTKSVLNHRIENGTEGEEVVTQ